MPTPLKTPGVYIQEVNAFGNPVVGFPNVLSGHSEPTADLRIKGITALIDTLTANGTPTCEYYFDHTANTYGCAEQVLDPNSVCHAIDNYALRTTNMASYFATHIAPCSSTGIDQPDQSYTPIAHVFPNPTSGLLTIHFNEPVGALDICIFDVLGRVVLRSAEPPGETIQMNISALSPGLYYAVINVDGRTMTMPIQKQ